MTWLKASKNILAGDRPLRVVSEKNPQKVSQTECDFPRYNPLKWAISNAFFVSDHPRREMPKPELGGRKFSPRRNARIAGA